MKKVIVFNMLVSAFIGCRQSAPQIPFDDIVYVNSFPVTYEVKNGNMQEIDKIGIQDIMVCDSLLLVSTQNPDGFISVFDLGDGTSSVDFFKRGNGPGELLYALFFSTVNKVCAGDKTSLVLNDGKGNMLRWTPDSLLNGSDPNVEVVNDSVPLGLFYSLYVNDSTCICREVSSDASGQIRYLLTSGKRSTTSSMDKLNSLSIPVKGDGYMFNILSSFSKYSVSEDIVVEASLMLNTINMYSLDGSFEKTICYGKKMDNIDDVFYGGMRGLKETFTRVNIYDDFFAVMYSSGKMYPETSRRNSLPKIFIFDWSGEPKAELCLQETATVFDMDISNGVLYTLDRTNETVRKYDISEIMCQGDFRK